MQHFDKTGISDVFRNRSVRWYWTNAVVSAFGDSLTSVALLLLVLRETGSLSMMAGMSIVIAVPGIVFGVLSAVWVDRWDAKRVVVLSQCVRAILILGLVYVDLGHHIGFAFVLAFFQSLVGTFDDPARIRLIRTLTDNATRLSVNSFTSSGTMIASILGTTIGGTLVGTLDRYWPSFALDSMTFLIGAFAVSCSMGDFAAVPRTSDVGQSKRFLDESLEGIRATFRSPVLSAVMIAASAATLGLSAATIMLLPLITEVLNIQPGWFGAVEAAQSGSAILVSLAVGIIGNRINARPLVVVGLIGTGVAIAAIGSAVNIWTLLVAMFVVGLFITPTGSGYSTLLQTFAPKNVIGRVAAAMNTVIQACGLVAIAAAGFLGEYLGIRETMWIAGAICIGAGILAWVLLTRPGEDALTASSMPSTD